MEKCAKEGCDKKATNKYCLKHQICIFVDETEEAGLKVCSNYIRGCRNQQPVTYKKKTCEDCLKKDRDRDKERRKEAVETDEGTKSCKTCFQVYSIDNFQGIHGETLTCKFCRDANKRADAKRDKEHMNELSRKNDKKPERIAVKKEWKEKNPEKCAKYWIDARKRLIENDLEGFLKKNAEQAKKWRDANPEKVKENNESRIKSIYKNYTIYKSSAKSRGLSFTITEDEFTHMVKTPCYYCGILQEKGFNGIDRVDSTKSYNKENCVGCCEMCNRMKCSLGPNIFVHRSEHILTHLQIVQGNLYPSEFKDSLGCTYSEYVDRACKKSIPFDVSSKTFYKFRNESCYLCGKEKSDTNINGIDRFDNTKGYTEENIRSCCCNCNYMKKNYEYECLIHKLKMIYDYQKKSPIQDCENKEIKYIVAGNKLSKEEKKEKSISRKLDQMNTLREKYTNGDTEEWISKIVKNRKDKLI